MADRIRVIQYGLGPIGCAVARHVVERGGLELVGAVDVDPAKIGRDVGEVIGLGHPLGFAVTQTLAGALMHDGAHLALHATGSYLDRIKPQIIEILEAGLDVVSTAEELCFPWLAHSEQAAEIDSAAKRMGRTVLATGVNPGFVMDSLPLFLTAICQQVDHVEVNRLINASVRRGPFQAKIGCGMTVEDFRIKASAAQMGHVGLSESMAMVFSAMGRRLARFESTIDPVVAKELLKTDYFEVSPGQVCGLRQVARGCTETSEFMTLTFVAALGMEEDGDTIRIMGKPNLELKLKGANGDIATVALIVNAVRRVIDAAPGLVTMRDLPILSLW